MRFAPTDDVGANYPPRSVLLRQIARALRSIDLDSMTTDELRELVSGIEAITGRARASDLVSPADPPRTRGSAQHTLAEVADRLEREAATAERYEQN